MTFSGRIRLLLILVAVVPPLLIMLAIYVTGQSRTEVADRRLASRSLEQFAQYRHSLENELAADIRAIAQSPYIIRATLLLGAGREREVRLDAIPSGLDFLEILDSDYRVLVSYHRPGLIGEPLPATNIVQDNSGFAVTLEYDTDGPHPALATTAPVDNRFLLYAGRYLDADIIASAERLVGANIRVLIEPDNADRLKQMSLRQLYAENDSLTAVLLANESEGLFIVAGFPPGPQRSVYGNLLLVTGLVALGSIILAVMLGIYVTGRAKREIDNLVTATDRVAGGDFTTPVMAYQEGEFSQLADSFTEMTFRLREVQHRLGLSEKIAAWQAMGRKIAHEVKNPLTPIAISTDDLRRSYRDNLDNFPKILDETTATIKSEVHRLTQLLDEFVRFARMRPPEIKNVDLHEFIDNIASLYRTDTESGRLKIQNQAATKTARFDPEAMRQVVINLIKNGIESSGEAIVTLTVTDDSDYVLFRISDTGPGFTDEILQRGFEPYVSTKKGGSGLGLVISQRIVHDHGGSIELSNQADSGAQITIRLPVKNG